MRSLKVTLLSTLLLVAVFAVAEDRTPAERLSTILMNMHETLDAGQGMINLSRQMGRYTNHAAGRECLAKTISVTQQYMADIMYATDHLSLERFNQLRRSDPEDAEELAEEVVRELEEIESRWTEGFVDPGKCRLLYD